jgi:ribosome-binding protein aMBF1 (putative translation factor)
MLSAECCALSVVQLSAALHRWSIMKIGGFAKEFGKHVRAAREKRGMSQEDLADAAELHRTHISLIERGLRTVRIDTVGRLAYALRVQPGELMPKLRLPTK